MSRAMGDRVGLAICKGVHMGSPRSPYQAKCAKWVMCPRCESEKAARVANRISRRLETEFELADGDLTVGVLTWTLPGKNHPIRRGSLREQYDYATARTRLKGLPGDHSMRGLNLWLNAKGARGGTHFLEFTWNPTRNWWNLHGHTLFWAWMALDDVQATTVHRWDPAESLLEEKTVLGKRTRVFPRLGFGERYSLDYAEEHELQSSIRYSSKVAYTTKPFKAPISKKAEIRDFLIGVDGPEPRLSRPFGEATKPMVQNVLDGWF